MHRVHHADHLPNSLDLTCKAFFYATPVTNCSKSEEPDSQRCTLFKLFAIPAISTLTLNLNLTPTPTLSPTQRLQLLNVTAEKLNTQDLVRYTHNVWNSAPGPRSIWRAEHITHSRNSSSAFSKSQLRDDCMSAHPINISTGYGGSGMSRGAARGRPADEAEAVCQSFNSFWV